MPGADGFRDDSRKYDIVQDATDGEERRAQTNRFGIPNVCVRQSYILRQRVLFGSVAAVCFIMFPSVAIRSMRFYHRFNGERTFSLQDVQLSLNVSNCDVHVRQTRTTSQLRTRFWETQGLSQGRICSPECMDIHIARARCTSWANTQRFYMKMIGDLVSQFLRRVLTTGSAFVDTVLWVMGLLQWYGWLAIWMGAGTLLSCVMATKKLNEETCLMLMSVPMTLFLIFVGSISEFLGRVACFLLILLAEIALLGLLLQPIISVSRFVGDVLRRALKHCLPRRHAFMLRAIKWSVLLGAICAFLFVNSGILLAVFGLGWEWVDKLDTITENSFGCPFHMADGCTNKQFTILLGDANRNPFTPCLLELSVDEKERPLDFMIHAHGSHYSDVYVDAALDVQNKFVVDGTWAQVRINQAIKAASSEYTIKDGLLQIHSLPPGAQVSVSSLDAPVAVVAEGAVTVNFPNQLMYNNSVFEVGSYHVSNNDHGAVTVHALPGDTDEKKASAAAQTSRRLADMAVVDIVQLEGQDSQPAVRVMAGPESGWHVHFQPHVGDPWLSNSSVFALQKTLGEWVGEDASLPFMVHIHVICPTCPRGVWKLISSDVYLAMPSEYFVVFSMTALKPRTRHFVVHVNGLSSDLSGGESSAGMTAERYQDEVTGIFMLLYKEYAHSHLLAMSTVVWEPENPSESSWRVTVANDTPMVVPLSSGMSLTFVLAICCDGVVAIVITLGVLALIQGFIVPWLLVKHREQVTEASLSHALKVSTADGQMTKQAREESWPVMATQVFVPRPGILLRWKSPQALLRQEAQENCTVTVEGREEDFNAMTPTGSIAYDFPAEARQLNFSVKLSAIPNSRHHKNMQKILVSRTWRRSNYADHLEKTRRLRMKSTSAIEPWPHSPVLQRYQAEYDVEPPHDWTLREFKAYRFRLKVTGTGNWRGGGISGPMQSDWSDAVMVTPTPYVTDYLFLMLRAVWPKPVHSSLLYFLNKYSSATGGTSSQPLRIEVELKSMESRPPLLEGREDESSTVSVEKHALGVWLCSMPLETGARVEPSLREFETEFQIAHDETEGSSAFTSKRKSGHAKGSILLHPLRPSEMAGPDASSPVYGYGFFRSESTNKDVLSVDVSSCSTSAVFRLVWLQDMVGIAKSTIAVWDVVRELQSARDNVVLNLEKNSDAFTKETKRHRMLGQGSDGDTRDSSTSYTIDLAFTMSAHWDWEGLLFLGELPGMSFRAGAVRTVSWSWARVDAVLRKSKVQPTEVQFKVLLVRPEAADKWLAGDVEAHETGIENIPWQEEARYTTQWAIPAFGDPRDPFARFDWCLALVATEATESPPRQVPEESASLLGRRQKLMDIGFSSTFFVAPSILLSDMEIQYAAFCRAHEIEMEEVTRQTLEEHSVSVTTQTLSIVKGLRTPLECERDYHFPQDALLECPGQQAIEWKDVIVPRTSGTNTRLRPASMPVSLVSNRVFHYEGQVSKMVSQRLHLFGNTLDEIQDYLVSFVGPGVALRIMPQVDRFLNLGSTVLLFVVQLLVFSIMPLLVLGIAIWLSMLRTSLNPTYSTHFDNLPVSEDMADALGMRNTTKLTSWVEKKQEQDTIVWWALCLYAVHSMFLVGLLFVANFRDLSPFTYSDGRPSSYKYVRKYSKLLIFTFSMVLLCAAILLRVDVDLPGIEELGCGLAYRLLPHNSAILFSLVVELGVVWTMAAYRVKLQSWIDNNLIAFMVFTLVCLNVVTLVGIVCIVAGWFVLGAVVSPSSIGPIVAYVGGFYYIANSMWQQVSSLQGTITDAIQSSINKFIDAAMDVFVQTSGLEASATKNTQNLNDMSLALDGLVEQKLNDLQEKGPQLPRQPTKIGWRGKLSELSNEMRQPELDLQLQVLGESQGRRCAFECRSLLVGEQMKKAFPGWRLRLVLKVGEESAEVWEKTWRWNGQAVEAAEYDIIDEEGTKKKVATSRVSSVSFTAFPALPKGVVLDATTGLFEGQAAEKADRVSYHVMAKLSWGNTQDWTLCGPDQLGGCEWNWRRDPVARQAVSDCQGMFTGTFSASTPLSLMFRDASNDKPNVAKTIAQLPFFNRMAPIFQHLTDEHSALMSSLQNRETLASLAEQIKDDQWQVLMSPDGWESLWKESPAAVFASDLLDAKGQAKGGFLKGFRQKLVEELNAMAASPTRLIEAAASYTGSQDMIASGARMLWKVLPFGDGTVNKSDEILNKNAAAIALEMLGIQLPALKVEDVTKDVVERLERTQRLHPDAPRFRKICKVVEVISAHLDGRLWESAALTLCHQLGLSNSPASKDERMQDKVAQIYAQYPDVFVAQKNAANIPAIARNVLRSPATTKTAAPSAKPDLQALAKEAERKRERLPFPRAWRKMMLTTGHETGLLPAQTEDQLVTEVIRLTIKYIEMDADPDTGTEPKCVSALVLRRLLFQIPALSFWTPEKLDIIIGGLVQEGTSDWLTVRQAAMVYQVVVRLKAINEDAFVRWVQNHLKISVTETFARHMFKVAEQDDLDDAVPEELWTPPEDQNDFAAFVSSSLRHSVGEFTEPTKRHLELALASVLGSDVQVRSFSSLKRVLRLYCTQRLWRERIVVVTERTLGNLGINDFRRSEINMACALAEMDNTGLFEMRDLLKVFKMLSARGVNQLDFQNFLKRCKIRVSPKWSRQIFNSLDTDNTGYITIEEFIMGTDDLFMEVLPQLVLTELNLTQELALKVIIYLLVLLTVLSFFLYFGAQAFSSAGSTAQGAIQTVSTGVATLFVKAQGDSTFDREKLLMKVKETVLDVLCVPETKKRAMRDEKAA